jgi:hypothetical protein
MYVGTRRVLREYSQARPLHARAQENIKEERENGERREKREADKKGEVEKETAINHCSTLAHTQPCGLSLYLSPFLIVIFVSSILS